MQIHKSYISAHWVHLTMPGRWPGIDLLRAIAVLLVLFFHLNYGAFRFGWIGVDLFFVISGFLIGGALWDGIQNRTHSFYKFYRNRALRILPIYYFFVLLTCISNSTYSGSLNVTDPVSLQSILHTLVFTQTTYPFFFSAPFDYSVTPGGSWSLVIEEYFYLLCPLVLFFIGKCFPNKVLICLGGIVLPGLLVRYISMQGFNPDDYNWHFANFVQFHSRYDELAAGVLAAIAARAKTNSFLVIAGFAFGILSIVGVISFLAGNESYWLRPDLLTRETLWLPSVLGVGFAGLVFSLCRLPFAGTMSTAIARLSFPMYLGHIWLIASVVRPLKLDALISTTFASIFLFIPLSVLFAYLLSLVIEYPFINYYKKEYAAL